MFRSLRLRLLLGSGVVILTTLCVVWLTMSFLVEEHLQLFEITGMKRQAQELEEGFRVLPHGRLAVFPLPPDPRYFHNASGHYWQLSLGGATVRSQSLGEQNLPKLIPLHDQLWHTRTATGPFGQTMILLERRIKIGNVPDVVLQLADSKLTVSPAEADFGRELFVFLIGLWIVLSGAAALQVHLGLEPLSQLRQALDALRVSPSKRLSIDKHPREVEPLTRAINELAEAREQDVVRARHRAADLAHSLKTPLAVLSAGSQRVRENGGVEIADGLDRAIMAAATAIEAELARSRIAAARRSIEPESAPVRLVAERVISVVENTEAGAKLVFEVDVANDLSVPGSTGELSEILGALTENAARFAHRRVRISAGNSNKDMSRLTIEDDGPGLADERAQEVLIRGHRLDERGWGHGLGLSIARDLVEAREGKIRLGRSEMGGLLVEMTWMQEQKA